MICFMLSASMGNSKQCQGQNNPLHLGGALSLCHLPLQATDRKSGYWIFQRIFAGNYLGIILFLKSSDASWLPLTCSCTAFHPMRVGGCWWFVPTYLYIGHLFLSYMQSAGFSVTLQLFPPFLCRFSGRPKNYAVSTFVIFPESPGLFSFLIFVSMKHENGSSVFFNFHYLIFSKPDNYFHMYLSIISLF